MGVRAQNIKSLLKDARSRTILIITFGALIVAIVIGYFVFHKKVMGPGSQAAIESTPGLTSIPTGSPASPEYAELVRQANIARAQQAVKTGGSAIPTIIKAVNPGNAQAIPGGLGFQQLAQSQGGTPKLFVLDALKQNNCDPKDLAVALKQGLTIAELKQGGCSAEQLEHAGLTPAQLQNGGFSACDLLGANGVNPSAMKNAGYSAGELRGVGYNACQLKNAGYTAAQLLSAGFNPEELKGVGFGPSQIASAEEQVPSAGMYSFVPKLPPGITAETLKAGGCGVAAVQQDIAAGVSSAAMRAIGCSATQLKQGGYPEQQLKDGGYTAGELKNAGVTASDLKDAGFTAAEAKAAGFRNVKPPVTALDALKTAGCGVAAVQKAEADGVSVATMRRVGCTIAQLKDGGFTAGELKDAGFTAQELKNAGFTVGELRAAGFSATALKDAGFSAAELKNAGFTAGELAAAGFSPTELKDAGYNAAQSRAAGFSASDLKSAGFNATELKNAGFSPNELSTAFPENFSNVASIPANQQQLATTVLSPETISNNNNVNSAEAQQQAAVQQQQLQQQQQVVQASMSSQVSQLFSAWSPPTQTLVQGTPPPPTQAGAGGVGGASGISGAGGVGSTVAPIVKAGTIMFAVLTTSVNSDYPGPVLATIVSGKFKNARLIGSLTTFPPYGKQVMLSFNTLNSPLYPSTISINAVAISPKTAQTALSDYTNNHYLIRFGTLFASSFLEGYGQAFLQSGQSVISTAASTTVSSPSLSPKGKFYVALGNVGNQFGSLLQPYFDMPPTVHVYSGTGVGILFLSDVAQPAAS